MTLTEKDVQLFRALNQSETGRQLLDYLDRLLAHLADVRYMKAEEMLVRKDAISLLEQHVVEHVRLSGVKKETELNQFV